MFLKHNWASLLINMHLFYAMEKNKHNKYVYCWEEMLQYVLILAPTHKRLQMVPVSSITKPGSSIDPYSLKTFQCFHTKLGKFKSCLIWAEEGSRLSSVLSDGNDVKANNCKFKICIYPSIENHWNNFAKFLNFKIVPVCTLPELLLTVPQALGFSDEFHEFCFGDWSYGSVLPAALAVTGQRENIFSS